MDYKIIEEFHKGHCLNAYDVYGAHFEDDGVRFTVWAPHAKSVEVLGPFNNWGENPIYLDKITDQDFSGFVKGVKENTMYRYRIETPEGEKVQKSDPFAFYSELRPSTNSITMKLDTFKWADKMWMKKRTKNFDRPVNIYEVHAGGWKKGEDNKWLTYEELAEQLIPYVVENGYTHIELMPLNEHPFDGSWGYQASGYYSCTSRYGEPRGFMKFVNMAHKAGIGIIMDVVPVHFVKDNFGLRLFDGRPCYEYNNENAESEWGTCNFDLWKEEVRSFLMSSMAFWCDKYHVDGIRMDAISNVIYWGGNKSRGENQGGLDFLKRTNYYLSAKFPGLMLIAEDSSDFGAVTHSTLDGGLGFDYKWDMGWMNDTLKYYKIDPIYRQWNHNLINWSMAYFYQERFVMTFSHDEVVHGKKTILDKMWGTYEQQFAQTRNLYLYMMTHPGKKLNFMSNEIGQIREFDEMKENDWFLLKYPVHDAFRRYTSDLNKIYYYHPSLYKYDYEQKGYKWIDADNAKQSIYSYYREADDECLVVILNMTPVSYEAFSVNVPYKGTYTELINSEKDIYSGCNMCNYRPIRSKYDKINKRDFITIRIAPFAGIIFTCKKRTTKAEGKIKNV